jgi:TM2 domain-containing membrane protein YozV
MSGATFGRKGAGPEADLAARRAAFLAAERARSRQPPPREEIGAAARPVFVREKSLGTAYLLWFFVGGLSVHRFYLGFAASGVIQVTLVVLAYALIFSKSPVGLALLAGWAVWLFADAFLILAMHRKANERVRRGAVASVFV